MILENWVTIQGGLYHSYSKSLHEYSWARQLNCHEPKLSPWGYTAQVRRLVMLPLPQIVPQFTRGSLPLSAQIKMSATKQVYRLIGKGMIGTAVVQSVSLDQRICR